MQGDAVGTAVERFGFGVAAGTFEQPCQVVQAGADIGMVGAQGFLGDGQGAAIVGFGLGIGAQIPQRSC